ncbi:hypothetical protein CTAYLR_003942 [Chrysophaeum taylorii]|uniref:Cyclic nucleotide-binding domain-containing protein n=1 Tax=Chrysophaeum taylorii TaxID=2483200 RepID=A0AAD7XJS3_9STRA|nr:hypothetical protein CTAYLR_003942 [Chrysophaeum taylorii]
MAPTTGRAPRRKSSRKSGGITLDDFDIENTTSSNPKSPAFRPTTNAQRPQMRAEAQAPVVVTENRRDFPEELARQHWMFNPSLRWRFFWDVYLMMLMLFVLYVTPFELAFVNRVPRWGGLQILNDIVDVGFFVDILITLNTAYFDKYRNAWVVNRWIVWRKYCRLWLWIDMAALMRWYEIMHFIRGTSGSGSGSNKGLRLLKLVRLLRLVRLVRILKAPEIMARLTNRMPVSFKTTLVVKYCFLLISLLHLEACCLRISHDILRHNRRNLHITSFLSVRFRLYRSHFKTGNFALYVDSFDWAFQTLLGQSMYTNTTEGVMSILNNFVGVMYISFLIGELANVMCNLDPAKNEYKKTVDMLNSYMGEHAFPNEMKWQLRVYLAHSEDLFRARFHDDLVERLSPPLQELVAHFMLGGRVLQAPFFSYARQATLGLVAGRVIWVKCEEPRQSAKEGFKRQASAAFNTLIPHQKTSKERVAGTEKVATETQHKPLNILHHHRREYARPAKIIMLRPNMHYDIRFIRDGEEIERNVPHSRISMDHEPPEVQRAVDNMNHVTKLIVTQFAKVMKITLYNGGDYVIRKNVSRTKRMYLVDQGNVVSFGRDITKPFSVQHYREGGAFGDSELAMLAAGHRPRLHWYNARATVMARILVLNADDFLDIISTPGYENFFKYIQRYGVWANFKIGFYQALKDGTLHDRILGTWLDESQQLTLNKLDQSKMYEAMMVGAASTHFERLLASKLASQSHHTDELLSLSMRNHELTDDIRGRQIEELQGQVTELTTKLDLVLKALHIPVPRPPTPVAVDRPSSASAPPLPAFAEVEVTPIDGNPCFRSTRSKDDDIFSYRKLLYKSTSTTSTSSHPPHESVELSPRGSL